MQRSHWRIDWKVLVFALFGCYFIPWVATGAFLEAFYGPSRDEIERAPFGLVFVGATLLSPALAGYFTARFASDRPQLHVALIALLGPLLQVLASQASIRAYFGYLALTALCCCLGAFVALRSGARRH